ncbi:MAG: HDIG domain-containing protein, partial [Anaerolineae bacterium]|nr:HDIG domain-containing protein [Phycisphaerae bacterium]
TTLLLAQLAAIGSSPLYVFGIAPTILVAMILAIAYDQRYAVGIASMHAVMITINLNAPLSFLLIAWAGIATCALLLDDVRTRSKLIEIGGAAALAMIVTTVMAGLVQFDPPRYIMLNSLYTGAAGLAVGFIVLGILPFIEKAFRITTSMTLLELADASHPLLRRLSLEAPGTYNHSLQVATLSEEASEAIGANALLCRVASYYHDVGKINKPEYFVENQIDGMNRHLNLDPNLSFLIILGHVKDGVELAREYNLPTSIFTFIQQHHGTTLVEYFYHRACTQQEQRDSGGPAVSDMQYRYPGPKPKSKEIAVVMLADCVESATRAMAEPTASRIESLVHDLAMKRLMDGQFDECDLTMRDIERIERSLVKTLLGIYHGRIAYPSTVSKTAAPTSAATAITASESSSARSA